MKTTLIELKYPYLLGIKKIKTAIMLTIYLLINSSINAQTLDPTFNQTGYNEYIVGLNTNMSFNMVNAVALRSDGKILNAGYTMDLASYYNDVAISRLKSDGVIDSTFNILGYKIISFSSLNDICSDMKIQNDGKILMTVQADSFSGSWYYYSYLVRLNEDGTFDNTFGNSGKVRIDSTGLVASNLASEIVIQHDGKIILATTHIQQSLFLDAAVLRFNSDGTPDATFGNNGRTIFGFADTEEPRSLALQSDGKIVIAGDTYNPLQSSNNTLTDIFVARLNVNGSLDATFGTNGIYTDTVGSENDRLSDIAIQSNGRIVISGGYQIGDLGDGNWDIFTARLLSNGQLDNSYGSNGFYKYAYSINSEGVSGLALQNDGKIIVVGSTVPATQSVDFLMIRFLSNGTLDPAFGTNGVYLLNLVLQDAPRSCIFQPDWKLVVSGNDVNCLNCPVKSVSYRFTDITNGVSEHNTELKNKMILFPNPAQTELNITSQTKIEAISIFSIEGKMLKKTKVNSNNCKVDVSIYSKGIYFIKILSEDRIYSEKVVIE